VRRQQCTIIFCYDTVLILWTTITCSHCSKVYKSTKTYNQHIDLKRCKVEIESIVVISCQYCSKEFTRNFNKTKHEIKCDKNPKCMIEQLKMKIKYEGVINPTLVNKGTINNREEPEIMCEILKKIIEILYNEKMLLSTD